MSHDRVVRVTAGTQGQGSGYLLTPRHALTARHVFGKRAKTGQRCTLEPLTDALGAPTHLALSGKLGWLPKDAALDLAVIVLDEPAPGVAGAIELVRLPANSADPLAVLGTGFPLAVEDVSHTFRGQVNLEPLEQMLELTVTSALPRQDGDWSGASGTVLLAQERAVGVVATVDLSFQGRLSAVPLHRLLEAPGFADWWRAQAQPALVMRTTRNTMESALEEIVSHIHWLDREQPFQQAQNHIKLATQAPQALPRLVFMPGRTQDLHRHLIQRIAESAQIQRLLGRQVAPQDLLVELPWPAACQPVDQALSEVLGPLFDATGLPAPASLDDADVVSRLAAALGDRSLPNAWWVQLHRAVSGPGTGALLDALIGFWSTLPVKRPLFLFICLALDEPPARQGGGLLGFLSRPKQPDLPRVEEVLEAAYERLGGKQAEFLDDLEPIMAGHVSRWVSQTLAHCRLSSAPQRQVFEAELAQRVGPAGQPLEPVVAMLPAAFGAALLNRQHP